MNENYSALHSSASVYFLYDIARRSYSMIVRCMNHVDAGEGTRLTRRTDHAYLQYNSVFWHDLYDTAL